MVLVQADPAQDSEIVCQYESEHKGYVTESEFLNSGVVGAFDFNVARDGEFNDTSGNDCTKVNDLCSLELKR